ncbi:hypothetical protein [Acidiferrobacter sp.]|uniref:hypothetical protein n=1 Tax=Acidiferrobacter sp. TaxID=1872107 RepID=UPI002626BC4C|nr:hypothetical protein [Acidiferrobacter sp.]
MVAAKRIILGAGALAWAAVSAAQPPQIAAGEWQMTAHTNTGPMHYSTCLRGGAITAQKILHNEGSHCRMAGPVIIQGPFVTVSEVCHIGPAGDRAAIRIHVSARLRLSPSGESFSGRTDAIVTSRFGRVTEHQRIEGVRTGPCAGGG